MCFEGVVVFHSLFFADWMRELKHFKLLPSLATSVQASCHFVQTGEKKERGGKRELYISTISYYPWKTQMSGVTLHKIDHANLAIQTYHIK